MFSRWGHFLVASDLRTVKLFQARVRCAGRISIPTMPLDDGRRFTYRKRLRVRRVALRFEVAGRFRDRRTALGYLRARSAQCDSGKVPFVARLS